LGRLAAGVVVIWAEEATRGCTTCCCSAEFAAAVRGAVVSSAIVGGPALAAAGDAETATVAAITSAAATDTTGAVAAAAVAVTAFFAAAVAAAAVAAAAVTAAAVGWEVERVPGCKEEFLLSSHSAFFFLFFSTLLGFAGRLLDRFLLTAFLPAGISLHVKLICCPPHFVCSTNLAGVRFTRHSQYSESALDAMGPRICVALLKFCPAEGGEGVVLE
jgi:hypothetical protein